MLIHKEFKRDIIEFPKLKRITVNGTRHYIQEGRESSTPYPSVTSITAQKNKEAIKQSIEYHNDYHIKPVLDKNLSMVGEVEEFINELNIPNEKIWAMPAGDDRTSLFESYGPVMNFVRDRGWRYTGRAHIMAFDTERCV